VHSGDWRKALTAVTAAILLLGIGSQEDEFLIHSKDALALRSFATKHDIAGIEAMKSRVLAAKRPALTGAYYVALYLADPRNHETDFIANYPWRYNQEVSLLFDGKQWGLLAVVDPLAKIAVRTGDTQTIRLLFLASNYSDGYVSEGFSDGFTGVAKKWPRETLAALRSLPTIERDRALKWNGCLNTPQMTAIKPHDYVDRALISQIRAIPSSNCP